jgi:hypothetical protein
MLRPQLAAVALLCVAAGCYGAAAPRAAEPSFPANIAMSIPATLVERINRNGDVNEPATPRPLLTLEEFFEGNDDFGSIGYNLPDQPSPAEFYSLLKEIRNRTDVADVRIEVLDHPDPSASFPPRTAPVAWHRRRRHGYRRLYGHGQGLCRQRRDHRRLHRHRGPLPPADGVAADDSGREDRGGLRRLGPASRRRAEAGRERRVCHQGLPRPARPPRHRRGADRHARPLARADHGR